MNLAAQLSSGHGEKLDSSENQETTSFLYHIQHVIIQTQTTWDPPDPEEMQYSKGERDTLILTNLVLVLLLSSSGMGRNTARAIQLAKMVNKMMISNVLDGGWSG